jgi:hypothetical protein
MPLGLRRWIQYFEPDMQGEWQALWGQQQEVLPVLARFAELFDPRDRRDSIRRLFELRGFPPEVLDMFDHPFLGFDDRFGHVEYRVSDNIDELKWILAAADRFVSLCDDRGHHPHVVWRPGPAVEDRGGFVAGGLHQPSAVRAWEQLPGISSWPLTWVRNKVFMHKKPGAEPARSSIANAGIITPGHPEFQQCVWDFVDSKIASDLRKGAIKCLGSTRPGTVCRISIAEKKGDGDPWRICIDARPENAQYEKLKCKLENLLHFHSIFDKDSLLFSLDLRSAYYSLAVQKAIGTTMGFWWDGKYYRYKVCPFGWSRSAYCFIKITRQFIKKWRSVGPGDWQERFKGSIPEIAKGVRCQQYIDDSAAGDRRFVVCVWMRNAMMLELAQLGFTFSPKGDLLPLPSLRYLGLIAHLACPRPCWLVPEEKMANIEEVAASVLEADATTCRSVAKVAGKVSSCSMAVPIGRLMSRELVRTIYDEGKGRWAKSAKFQMSVPSRQELQWIAQHLRAWNQDGHAIWRDSQVQKVTAVLTQDSGPTAAGFRLTDIGQERSIEGTILFNDAERAELEHVHRELWGLLLALIALCRQLAGQRIRVQVDSVASVEYIRQLGGRSRVLTNMVKLIWAVSVRGDFAISEIEHISGKCVIALGVDGLSRPKRWRRSAEHDRDEWRLSDRAFLWLQSQLAVELEVDRTADRGNKRCAQYNALSVLSGGESVQLGCFSSSWHGVKNYSFPPFWLIPRILQHIRESQAWACLVLPEWPSQPWWVDMCELRLSTIRFPQGMPMFERPTAKGWEAVQAKSFTPIAVVVTAW